MVTNNQEGIEGKDKVIIIRVGKIITKTRMTLTIIERIIMLVRERKKNRRSFLVNFVKMITLPTYAQKSRNPQGSYHNHPL
jgi:hypothetical protein